MTDEELRKVYAETYESIPLDSHEPRVACALRAVFLAGARAQREMQPTNAMLNIDFEVCTVAHSSEPRMYLCDRNKKSLFRAMQRVAPLVGGEK